MNKGLDNYSYSVPKISEYKICTPRIALNRLLKVTYDAGSESIYCDKMELSHNIRLSLYKICDKNRLLDISICGNEDCGDLYYSIFNYNYEMNQYIGKLKLNETGISKNEIDIINEYSKYKMYKGCKL